ncbi:MAG: type III pantothenate kinase [Bdellovibrionaceae bacterium]|nr:type III pantothenate kinase [Pseudobdellovibrionaceae bacterium]
MILCLDVGNTTIHGGVFDGDTLEVQFRRTSEFRASSDELGLFLRGVLRENGVEHTQIQKIAVCSVVPDAIHSLRNCCIKYFGQTPFILQAGAKTGLKIKYRNPLEVGADRIADAIAATHLYPGRNLIVGDFGTATTFSAVTKEREFLGGVILAGLRLSMEALEEKTAKLPSVEIISMKQALGRSTVESLQSGLFFGQIGMAKELTRRITEEVFADDPPIVIGTGGFSGLFEKSSLFDATVPDLVLRGLNLALKMNT